MSKRVAPQFTILPCVESFEPRLLMRVPVALPAVPFASPTPGLTGVYYQGDQFRNPAVTRIDPAIDFHWGAAAPDASMQAGAFAAHWTGQVVAPTSGTYTFTTVADDGVRLWVGGKLIINDWGQHSATADQGRISLQAGKAYDIRIDYFESNVPPATLALFWQAPGMPRVLVPTSALQTSTTNAASIDSPPVFTHVPSAGSSVGDVNSAPAVSVLPGYITAASNAVYNFDSATDTLTLTKGTIRFTADDTSGEPISLVASGASAGVLFQTSEHLAGLTLSGGAQALMVSLGAARTHSNHNALVIGTLGSADDPTFSIDSSSKLDLEDNDLIVHGGSLDATGSTEFADVAAMAAEGRNPAGAAPGQPDGAWNGNGLSSLSAFVADAGAGYEKIGLGVAVNSSLLTGTLASWQIGSFDEPLAANDIIVKYDYLGDYSFAGTVGAHDAVILQTEFDNGATNGHTWATACSVGDGLCDSTEAGLFQLQYGLGTGGNNGAQL